MYLSIFATISPHFTSLPVSHPIVVFCNPTIGGGDGPPGGMGGYGGGGGGGGYGGGGGGGGYGGGGGGGSKMKSFTSASELAAILAEEDTSPLVVGYFDESTNEKDKEIFEDLAGSDGYDYRFAMTTTKSALEELKFDGCAVVVYKPSKFLFSKLEKPKAR